MIIVNYMYLWSFFSVVASQLTQPFTPLYQKRVQHKIHKSP